MRKTQQGRLNLSLKAATMHFKYATKFASARRCLGISRLPARRKIRHRAINRSHQLLRKIHHATIKNGIDFPDFIARLVIVRMILYAEVQKRNALGVKRSVIGTVSPIVARLEIARVVTQQNFYSRLRRHRCHNVSQKRIVRKSGNPQRARILSAHHVQTHINRNAIEWD